MYVWFVCVRVYVCETGNPVRDRRRRTITTIWRIVNFISNFIFLTAVDRNGRHLTIKVDSLKEKSFHHPNNTWTRCLILVTANQKFFRLF